eukprot:gene25915-biopygen11738
MWVFMSGYTGVLTMLAHHGAGGVTVEKSPGVFCRVPPRSGEHPQRKGNTHCVSWSATPQNRSGVEYLEKS